MGQRTTRAKLMSYFPARRSAGAGYEFNIPFSRQQLADYLGVERSGLSLELGKMRDEGLLAFTKAISFSKRRRLTVPFLLRVKEPPLGVLASADNPRQPRSVGVLQMDEAATVCRDRQDSVSSYNLI